MSFILGRNLIVRKSVYMAEASNYNKCEYDTYNTIVHVSNGPGGGTRYVKVMGRLRGIDPPFSRHWEKI